MISGPIIAKKNKRTKAHHHDFAPKRPRENKQRATRRSDRRFGANRDRALTAEKAIRGDVQVFLRSRVQEAQNFGRTIHEWEKLRRHFAIRLGGPVETIRGRRGTRQVERRADERSEKTNGRERRTSERDAEMCGTEETEREEKTGKRRARRSGSGRKEEEKSIERDDAGLDAGEETEEGNKLERFWDDRDNYGKAKNTKETEIVDGVAEKIAKLFEHRHESVNWDVK